MTFKWVNGAVSYGSGLVFNHTSTKKENDNTFKISPNGMFTIEKNTKGEFGPVSDELGLKTASLIEDKYYVVVVEQNKEYCKRMTGALNKTLIVRGDPSNIELLQEEGLDRMDALIALTPNSESNIITCLLAKDHGVHKTIAFVDNMDYTRISQSIGVDTLINVKLIAANNVFRFVRKGKIEAIASLDGVDAEIIEFVIQKDNRLTKTAIGELHLPEDAVIAGVIRGEQHFFPDADFIIQKDDKVIVFAQYSAISRVERIFR
jgi:trk system potassium uptake protein TrkA